MFAKKKFPNVKKNLTIVRLAIPIMTNSVKLAMPVTMLILKISMAALPIHAKTVPKIAQLVILHLIKHKIVKYVMMAIS